MVVPVILRGMVSVCCNFPMKFLTPVIHPDAHGTDILIGSQTPVKTNGNSFYKCVTCVEVKLNKFLTRIDENIGIHRIIFL